MNILVTGSGGMIGRKLVQRLVAGKTLGGKPIQSLTLVDVVDSPIPAGAPKSTKPIVADFSEKGVAATLIQDKPDVVFHLAAIVSGDAEANFEKGYRINFNGSWALLEAIRQEHERSGYKPRFVFASTLAVFGPPFPDSIPDDFALTPSTSYGTQKAMTELLLADYSRKGYLDGVGVRLPTICIRPGKPNKAASSFFSGILREPLAGQEAPLPVGDDVRHWFASPRAAVGFFITAATIDTSSLGPRRSMTMPGVSATVGEQIEALRNAAGEQAVALIKRVEDPFVANIVKGWAGRYDAGLAGSMGFKAEKNFAEIIKVYQEDEMGR
ncbi:MAG TPA: D-erythronate dehydrogenase [Rhizomicrobium sp.]|jgi:nucleoside-diphosphate-sugar epimerase|nr:D-erythronate dehydrogenase [Rhizomicrobium sp.]